jgi:hypothetical protein
VTAQYYGSSSHALIPTQTLTLPRAPTLLPAPALALCHVTSRCVI